MGLTERLYRNFGSKAAPVAGGVRPGREPDFVGTDGARYTIRGAEQHGKAYAGGRDGIDWFYDAANVIAQATSSAEFHFEDKDGKHHVMHKGPQDPPEVVEVNPAVRDLYTHPNPWMGWQEHIELTVIDLLGVGNFFWLKWNADPDGNKPYALYRMAPPLVEVVAGKNHLIDHYRYGIGKDAIKVPPQMVVHGRLPNPHSDNAVLGAGVIQAAPQAFDIELGLLSAQRSYFQRGTVLAGALSSDKVIPETNRKKIARDFQRLHRGSDSWYNVAFLERGMRYDSISANAQEAGYEALSKLSRERIFAMLRVPLILSGLDTGTGGVMKLGEARRFLAEDVLPPFLNRLQYVLTTSLSDAWGLQHKFDTGYQMPEEDRVGVADQFSQLPGVKVREVREKAGLHPLGPDYEDEDGVQIDEYVLNLPGPSTEGPDGHADAQGTGRPPDPENQEKFPAAPNAGKRTTDEINGRRASAADRRRRERVQGPVAKPRARTGKALFSASELAEGKALELVGKE